jgi:hypothetical protein
MESVAPVFLRNVHGRLRWSPPEMKIVVSGTIEDGEEGGWYREMVRSLSRLRNCPGWREEPPNGVVEPRKNLLL